jgi:hypothetical protein
MILFREQLVWQSMGTGSLIGEEWRASSLYSEGKDTYIFFQKLIPIPSYFAHPLNNSNRLHVFFSSTLPQGLVAVGHFITQCR